MAGLVTSFFGGRMAFAIKHLDALKPKDKPYRELEGKARAGFGVQVSTGGKVTFIYLYRSPEDNRQRVMNLGAYCGVDRDSNAKNGGLTLKEAYAEYNKAKRIRDGGRDPQTIRDEGLAQEQASRKAEARQRQQEAMKGSIKQLIDAYITGLKDDGKRSWADAERVLVANVYAHIPEGTKAKDVEPDDIRAVLVEIIQRDALVMANRVRAYLSAAFTFGIHWDNDPKNHFNAVKFGIKSNPVRDVPKPLKTEKPRDRALTEAEVKQVWESFSNYRFRSKTVSVIRLLLALGGQRVEDILGIHQGDVDIENRLLTLRDTKNGSTHVVPFGDVAEPLLKECLLKTDSTGHLFGRMNGGKIGLISHKTIAQATATLCRKTGIEHFQPKDLRRTVKTLMGFAGIRKEDRDRFQNHALTDVSSRHYDRYDYLAEKRQVMAVWDAYLQSMLAGTPKSNVVPLRAARV